MFWDVLEHVMIVAWGLFVFVTIGWIHIYGYAHMVHEPSLFIRMVEIGLGVFLIMFGALRYVRTVNRYLRSR